MLCATTLTSQVGHWFSGMRVALTQMESFPGCLGPGGGGGGK